MHSGVGGDFTVPIADDLEFVEAVFEGVFVVGAVNEGLLVG